MRRSSGEHGAGREGRGVSRRGLLGLAPRSVEPRPELSGSSYDLINASRAAMGSYFEVRVSAGTPGAIDLASRALDLIDEIEDQLTVYRETSEVSQLNVTGFPGPVRVERGLFGLIERGIDLWEKTGGAYDLTSGALSAAWGFTRGPRRIPEPEVLAMARRRTGSGNLRLDREASTITFDVPGLTINLGSIGKGYAIDRAARLIADYWFPTSALIHGGRSSLFALGSPPESLGGRWEVAVYNPFNPSKPIGTVRLRNRGMGTSGSSFQQFGEGGRVYGHLIDPRTGEPPADGPLSVSVLAPTAEEADALSTAFYLLGPGPTAEYLARRPDLGVLFLLDAGRPDGPEVLALGMSEVDFVRSETLSALSP